MRLGDLFDHKLFGLVLIALLMVGFQNCSGFSDSGVNRSSVDPLTGNNSNGDDEYVDVDTSRPLLDQYESVSIAGPNSTPAGECSEAFSVQLLNSFNEPIVVTRNFSFSYEGIEPGTMYLDPGCTMEASGVTIPADSDRFQFYLLNPEPLLQNIVISIPRLSAPSKFHNVY